MGSETRKRWKSCTYGVRLLSLVHTGEISTNTNARHTHAQNQSSTVRTKPFVRVRMPRIYACACAYLTSVNQALGRNEKVKNLQR